MKNKKKERKNMLWTFMTKEILVFTLSCFQELMSELPISNVKLLD
jgi:hypothetical protein